MGREYKWPFNRAARIPENTFCLLGSPLGTVASVSKAEEQTGRYNPDLSNEALIRYHPDSRGLNTRDSILKGNTVMN